MEPNKSGKHKSKGTMNTSEPITSESCTLRWAISYLFFDSMSIFMEAIDQRRQGRPPALLPPSSRPVYAHAAGRAVRVAVFVFHFFLAVGIVRRLG